VPVPVKPPLLGLIVCGAVELFVMCTVPPHITLSELGEKAYDAPLLTIVNDVADVLLGQAAGAVEVGVGFALVFVAVGRGVVVVRTTGGAVVASRVAAAVGVGVAFAAGRLLGVPDGAAVGAAEDAVAIGLPLGAVVTSPPAPPLHAARATAHRARLTGNRRSDISPCTHRRGKGFSRRRPPPPGPRSIGTTILSLR